MVNAIKLSAGTQQDVRRCKEWATATSSGQQDVCWSLTFFQDRHTKALRGDTKHSRVSALMHQLLLSETKSITVKPRERSSPSKQLYGRGELVSDTNLLLVDLWLSLTSLVTLSKFYRKKGVPYFETSVKTGKNVSAGFLSLVRTLTGDRSIEFSKGVRIKADAKQAALAPLPKEDDQGL